LTSRSSLVARLAVAVLLAVGGLAAIPGAPAQTPPGAPAPTTAPAPAPPAAPPASPAGPAAPEAKKSEAQVQLDALRAEIDQIAAGVQREGLSDRQLVVFRTRAEEIRAQAGAVADANQPASQAVEARLKQLGPPPAAPKEGEAPVVEAEEVKRERDQQSRLLGELQGLVKQAGVIQLKADEVIKATGDQRRDRFTRELLEQSRSVLDPTLYVEAGAALPSVFNGFRLLVSDWVGLLVERGGRTAMALLGVALVFAFILLRPVRRRLIVLTERDAQAAAPPPFRTTGAAIGIVLFNVLLPLAAFAALYWTLTSLDLTPSRIEATLRAVIAGVFAASVVYSLALAVLAPSKPTWRLLAVGDGTASYLMGLFVGLGVTFGTGMFVHRMLDVLAAPVQLFIAASGFFAIIEITLLLMALRSVARSLAGEAEGDAQPAGDATEREHSLMWRWIVPVAWLAALVGLGAAAAGYVALARFISSQMIYAAAIVASLYVLLIFVDELIAYAFRRDTAVGASVNRSTGISREAVEQFGVVLSGFARLFLIALAAVLILVPWGLDSADILGGAKQAFFGFRVGGLTISPSSILIGIVVLFIGIVMTRGIQGWLDQRFLPKTRLDAGLKNSIRTAFGYSGYVVAVALAFSSVGLSLDNIAIVAGALSVGIGFGLQSIVNNFVSGLILLAERPIKAGDLVEVGAEKGFVRKINVRSTEIETFDRASLIVPNSSLITGNVKNWMHRDITGRVVVNVGVAYAVDPDRVREILLAAAKAHKLVLIFPSPSAFLVNFGLTGLEFRLICTVANVNDAFGVESDLRFAVLKRFKEEDIELANAQRAVNPSQVQDLRSVMQAFLKDQPG
jgi:small-conductance mechanosensitive channel